MKTLLSPRVIVPVVFSLGIIIFLLGYANVSRVVRAASSFQPAYLLVIVVLMLLYEMLRTLQWLVFLRALDPRQSGRAALMSFMGGEMAKALPGGQYFQTYLLREARGTPAACSAAATTMIIWLEVVVCLAVVAALGVASWPWMRPVSMLLLVGIGLVLLALRRRKPPPPAVQRLRRRTRLRVVWQWYDDFAGCAGVLLRGRTMATAGALSAAYIVCAAGGLWAICAALGVGAVGPVQALLVYTFSLGVGLIIPIPVDLGLTELSGLGILMALGIDRSTALTVMLMQRILSSLITAAIAAVSLVVVRKQVAAALHFESSPASPRGRSAHPALEESVDHHP